MHPKNHIFVFNRHAARAAGSNGGKSKNSGYLIYVDDRPWRPQALAFHLGISRTTLARRVLALRASGKSLTIQGLST